MLQHAYWKGADETWFSSSKISWVVGCLVWSRRGECANVLRSRIAHTDFLYFSTFLLPVVSVAGFDGGNTITKRVSARKSFRTLTLLRPCYAEGVIRDIQVFFVNRSSLIA